MHIKKPLERMLDDVRYIGTVGAIVVGATLFGAESCKSPEAPKKHSSSVESKKHLISYQSFWNQLDAKQKQELIPYLIIKSQDFTFLNSVMREITGRKDIKGEELNMFLTYIRTSLWQPIINEVEQSYLSKYIQFGWEQGLAFARIAAETGGDPLGVSPQGAAGLDQLLGGIATMYGIHTYNHNHSKSGNPMHGKALEALKKSVLPKDPDKMKESQIRYLLSLEGRFNPLASTPAGANYFGTMINTFGNIDHALSGYNSNNTRQVSYIEVVQQKLEEYQQLTPKYGSSLDTYFGDLVASRLVHVKPKPHIEVKHTI
jgi:hypothetical protein